MRHTVGAIGSLIFFLATWGSIFAAYGCTVRAHLSSLDVCFEEGCLVDTTNGESGTKSKNKNPQGFWAGLAGAQVVQDQPEQAPVTVSTTETKTTTAPEASLLPEAAK